MTFVSSLNIIWLVTILAAIFSEALTERLIAIWLAPAAAISIVLGVFGVRESIQVLAFLISAGVMIIAAQIIKAVVIKKRE